MTEDQISVILLAVSDARDKSTSAIGALATKVEGYHANLDARVHAIEAEQKSEKNWSRVNRALVPIYAIGHGILSHFGIKV